MCVGIPVLRLVHQFFTGSSRLALSLDIFCFAISHISLRYDPDVRCPVVATKLDQEKTVQAAHVKRVKTKLREIKGSLFDDKQAMPRAESVDVRRLFPRHSHAEDCYAYFNLTHANVRSYQVHISSSDETK